MTSPFRVDVSFAHRLDRIGIVLSIGCAAHCIAAPLLLLTAPVLGGLWVHPASHAVIAAVALPVAGFSLRRGYTLHGRRWIVTAGWFGVTCVLLGVLSPVVAVADHSPDETSLSQCGDCCPSVDIGAGAGSWSLRIPPASFVSLIGGIALVAAHFGNLRCCRRCGNPGERPIEQ